jgi:hypothetical protein
VLSESVLIRSLKLVQHEVEDLPRVAGIIRLL